MWAERNSRSEIARVSPPMTSSRRISPSRALSPATRAYMSVRSSRVARSMLTAIAAGRPAAGQARAARVVSQRPPSGSRARAAWPPTPTSLASSWAATL